MGINLFKPLCHSPINLIYITIRNIILTLELLNSKLYKHQSVYYKRIYPIILIIFPMPYVWICNTSHFID